MKTDAPVQTGLVARGLVKTYGSITVLKSVDLTLAPGSVVGLIGENGAGKSTFNSIIAGVVRPSGGQMWIDGEDYAPQSPSDAIARGVALIHQEIRLLPGLTVAENIFLGRLPTRGGRIDRARMRDEAQAVLTALGMRVDPDRKVGGLSMGVQQGIEIAKAILRKPRYVIFDEPTASLGEAEAEQILEQVRVLRDGGTGVIYVSHRLDEVRAIADQVLCLRDGNSVAHWDRAPEKTDMINAMVGRAFTFEHHAPSPAGHKVVLRMQNASRKGAFQGISFDLREGEILGFAGLVGAGRTDVVRALAGADRLDEGTVEVDGAPVRITSPRSAMDAGIFMVPEDRKGLGPEPGPLFVRQHVAALGEGAGEVRPDHPVASGWPWNRAEDPVRHPRADAPAGGVDVGRQPAEGASGQVAGEAAPRVHRGRTHPRRRCGRQDGNLRNPAQPRAVGDRRDRRVLRT
jgi:ribose transport system ATP-binding protein